ncbi:MAG: VOC family protein [Spirochaetales bacterium]|nr:VOC family protein [Spirochaetales bacterium]
MMIGGIQQIGLGVENVESSWRWYRKYFGMDVPIFQDEAEAPLMTGYTGSKVHSRNAVLAVNLSGGSGFEIWQFTSRKTAPFSFEPQLGDLGIHIVKMKSRDIASCYAHFEKSGVELLGGLNQNPRGMYHFYLKDPNGLIFEVCEHDQWFSNRRGCTGGPFGCVIGVADMEKAIPFYGDLLGYDRLLFDGTDIFEDMASVPGGEEKIRRVIMEPSTPPLGVFGAIFGKSRIELIECKDRKPRKIFQDRYWGDAGFIHLCFDVYGMDALKETCASFGHPFTVDSGDSFDMGEAAGRFSYIEDPDGTLIEFVETHRIPIVKSIGWFLNIKKRNPKVPLPDVFLKLLALGRVRD